MYHNTFLHSRTIFFYLLIQTGMMDPAYFVGKNVILKWLNDTFSFGYSKIEQTCTGAAHCQILDALYPGKVPLHRVNFDANKDYEYVANYKILQSIFDSENITKHIDVPKLIKGRYTISILTVMMILSAFHCMLLIYL